jgi:hypothetical protein
MTNRVIGLTYDVIRDYNSEVVLGNAAATVASIVGNANGQAVAGGFDTSAIEAQLDSLQDKVGEVLMNGASIVTNGVASFNLQAGENISISRDGRTLTISADGGGSNIYYGETIPSANLGVDKDLYLKIKNDTYFLNKIGESNAIKQQSISYSGNKATIIQGGETTSDVTQRYVVYQMDGLTIGENYTLSYDIQMNGYEDGHTNDNFMELRPVNGQTGSAFFTQVFDKNDTLQHYSISFTSQYESIWITFEYPNIIQNIPVEIHITDFSFGLNYFISGKAITDIYCKTGDNWIKDNFDVSITPLLQSGTKIAEYEIDGITGEIYIPNSGGVDYKTSEQNTGAKWIDGKPIYQKTVYIASPTISTSLVSIPNAISPNVDTTVEMVGTIDRDLASYGITGCISYDINNTEASNVYNYVRYDKYNDTLMYKCKFDTNTAKNLIVTIKYTKTTD